MRIASHALAVALFLSFCRPSYLEEKEPQNNHPESAPTISSQQTIRGNFILPNDQDCYRYEMKEPKMLRSKITGVKGLDVVIYVYNNDATKPVKVVDDNLSSLGESMGPILVFPPAAVVCVGAKTISEGAQSAKFLYEFSSNLFQPPLGVEKEPNDTFEEANQLEGESILGYYNQAVLARHGFGEEFSEKDFFRLSLPEPKRYLLSLELTAVSEIDPLVRLFNEKKQQILILDDRALNQGELLLGYGLEGPTEIYISIQAKNRMMNFSEYYELKVKLEEHTREREFEPNDSTFKATRLEQSPAYGLIADKGDVDFYYVENPTQWPVELELSLNTETQLNFLLEIWSSQNTKLYTFNDSSGGESEGISNYIISAADKVFIKVAVLPSQALFPASYTLNWYTRRWSEDREREPNNRIQEANAISIGARLMGYLNPNADQDTFRLKLAERRPVKILLEGIKGCRMLLRVADKTGSVYYTRESKQEGEGLSLTADLEVLSYIIISCSYSYANLYARPYYLTLEEY